jgi:integrase
MLTDARIRNAKPRKHPYKLSDGGGLHALIQPHGSKLLRFAYRYSGKQKTLALGVYPLVGLKAAREQRDEAKRMLARGTDPAGQRRLAKQAAISGNTFKAVAEEVFVKHQKEGRAVATLEKLRWLLDFVYPLLAERPIAEITAPELLAVLRRVEARGRYETARRLRGTCGTIFRYAIATGRAERDPSADLRGALTVPKVTHRATIVDQDGIGALLRAIEGYDGHPATKAALRLAPLVFVRPGELRRAEWSEFDLNGAQWSISAGKMKMPRPHRVPLARQAVAIVRELHKITGEGQWLFPSVRTATRPISDGTLNAALRRLGYGPTEMSPHGFRAMASTRLNEMGRWNPDAIERQLAHQEPDDVRRAYIHAAQFWPERVEMMQVWADYLDSLRDRGRSALSDGLAA